MHALKNTPYYIYYQVYHNKNKTSANREECSSQINMAL